MLAAAIAVTSAGVVLLLDVVQNEGTFVLAAVLGIFGSVVVLGLARQDTNRRRRKGYIETKVFFWTLNAIAIIGWGIGMLAVFLLSYEFSRDVG
jgi:hypothetical protein